MNHKVLYFKYGDWVVTHNIKFKNRRRMLSWNSGRNLQQAYKNALNVAKQNLARMERYGTP